MANYLGLKWNKNGALARNRLGKGISSGNEGLWELVAELDSLYEDARPIIGELFEEFGAAIADDTRKAVQKAHLPAGGRYSNNETERSIIDSPDVTWSGMVAEMPLGFDYMKQGAGGLLITGTPRMRPDRELEKIYVQKGKIQKRKKELVEKFWKQIQEGGGS